MGPAKPANAEAVEVKVLSKLSCRIHTTPQQSVESTHRFLSGSAAKLGPQPNLNLFLWCFSPKRNQTRVSPSKVKGYTKIDIQIPTRNYPPSEYVKLSGSRVPEPQFLASPREILGWRTPQTQEPDGLQSIQSWGVGGGCLGPLL